MGFIKGMINAFKEGYNGEHKKEPRKEKKKEPPKPDLSNEKSFFDLKDLIKNQYYKIKPQVTKKNIASA